MKAHGDYQIEVFENIVQIQFIGAFNEQGAKAAFKDLRQSIENLNGNHFLMLSDYQKLEGATPEAYNEVWINNKWLTQKNIIAKAIVFSSEAVKNIGFKHVPHVDINSKVFKCKDAGMRWLQQQCPT